MLQFVDGISKIYDGSDNIYFDSSGFDMIYKEFEIDPREYFNHARDDYYQNDESKNIDVITNCKRAIDCQIDSFYKYFNLIRDKNIRNNDSAKRYISYFESNRYKILDCMIKLKLFHVFDIAPIVLISNIRNVRNNIEHDYSKVKKERR